MSGDIFAGMRFFYLITAIILLAIAIVVYPTLSQKAKKRGSNSKG